MNEDNSSVNAIVPLTVTNTKDFDLPNTGGEGSNLFYILGGLAMIAAMGALILGLRKLRKKNA